MIKHDQYLRALDIINEYKIQCEIAINTINSINKIENELIRNTDLSERAKQCLRMIGGQFMKVGDLSVLTEFIIRNHRGIGRKTSQEIIDFCKKNNIEFNKL